MRISLRYVTHFVYPTPVWESHNALRACPARDLQQQLESYHVAVTPASRVLSYLDGWGTQVDAFGITDPHSELIVEVNAMVVTHPSRPAPDGSGSIDDRYRSDHWMYLQPSPHTRWSRDLEDQARATIEGSRDPLEAVIRLEAAIRDRLEYRPGATEVGTAVTDVWESRAGVCQDFAHALIALCRATGIAARYVSGYFYAADPTAADVADENEVTAQTHAWVEVAVPGEGWWPIDPTNPGPVGERHIAIGRGRDYDDVPPLRGVYFGDTSHALAAHVRMSTSSISGTDLPVVDQ